jgi:hypothetical protein
VTSFIDAYTVRALSRSPGFTVVAPALGIGVNALVHCGQSNDPRTPTETFA